MVFAVAMALGGASVRSSGFVIPASAQSAAPTTTQAAVLSAYDTALRAFRAVLAEEGPALHHAEPLVEKLQAIVEGLAGAG